MWIIGIVVLILCLNVVAYLHFLPRNKISFKETLDVADVPIITFRSNGKKLNFLLDTGSSRSVINIADIKGCDFSMMEQRNTLSGLDNKERIVGNALIRLEYRDEKYIEVIQVDDLSELFASIKQDKGVTIHGILGNSFFAKYKYVIDFKELAAYTKRFL